MAGFQRQISIIGSQPSYRFKPVSLEKFPNPDYCFRLLQNKKDVMLPDPPTRRKWSLA
jgi:hypothetical protein